VDEELRAELLTRCEEDHGTQFTYDKDELKPQPIEDPEHLDERRAAVGLGPFAEYEALMRRRH
jgi:hypothetical protein